MIKAYGGVAQLGERTVRIRKVESSILFVSTKAAAYKLFAVAFLLNKRCLNFRQIACAFSFIFFDCRRSVKIFSFFEKNS